MARSARAAIEDLQTCERCHAFFYVERAEEGARTRMRCTSCGHTRDVWLTDAKEGGYTVIDPDGKVMSFATWEEVVAARNAQASSAVTRVDHRTLPETDTKEDSSPPVESTERPERLEARKEETPSEPKKLSAAALLDVTPNPPKLALVETPVESPSSPGIDVAFPDSAPELPAAAAEPEEDIEAKRRASEAETLDESRVEEKPAAEEATVEEKIEAKTEEPRVVEEPKVEEPTAMPAVEEKVEAKAEEAKGEEGPRQITPLVIDDTSNTEKAIEELGEEEVKEPVEDVDDAEPLSLRDQIEEAEAVSLRDMVIVPALSPEDVPEEERHVSSTPPPPKRGTLKTLPPPPRLDAPPPPTITVDDGVPALTPEEIEKDRLAREKAEKKKSDPKVAAKEKTEAKKPVVEKVADKKESTAKTVPPSTRETSARPAASTVKKEEPAKRGWLLPAIGIAAAAAIVWRLMSSTQPQTPQPDPAALKPTANPTETASTVLTAPPPPGTADIDPPPPEPKATNGANNVPAPTTTGTTVVKPNGVKPEGKKPEGAPLSMSEALDKAGVARRSGDYAKARELYERVLRDNPANVEANGGLGDVARAQGDLNGAKTHYQKALAVSPNYGPAQMGLADAEWDTGNKAGAQKIYQAIAARLGANAPERVKQRAGIEGN